MFTILDIIMVKLSITILKSNSTENYKTSYNHSRGFNEILIKFEANLVRVHELWSDIQTNKQTHRDHYFICIENIVIKKLIVIIVIIIIICHLIDFTYFLLIETKMANWKYLRPLLDVYTQLWQLGPAHHKPWQLAPANLKLWQLAPAHLKLWQLAPAHLKLWQLAPAHPKLWQLAPAHLKLWLLAPAHLKICLSLPLSSSICKMYKSLLVGSLASYNRKF